MKVISRNFTLTLRRTTFVGFLITSENSLAGVGCLGNGTEGGSISTSTEMKKFQGKVHKRYIKSQITYQKYGCHIISDFHKQVSRLDGCHTRGHTERDQQVTM